MEEMNMAKRRMRFITWCKKDVNDERKINYTLKTYDNKVLNFTSVSHKLLHLLPVFTKLLCVYL